jgi:hypothetical protein
MRTQHNRSILNQIIPALTQVPYRMTDEPTLPKNQFLKYKHKHALLGIHFVRDGIQ